MGVKDEKGLSKDIMFVSSTVTVRITSLS